MAEQQKATVSYHFDGCRALVVDGSFGLGLAIASAFQQAGAEVAITGTRASAVDYDSDLSVFDYYCMPLGDRAAIDAVAADQVSLDVLVYAMPGEPLDGSGDSLESALQRCVAGSLCMAQACREKLAASTVAAGASIISLTYLPASIAAPEMSVAQAGVAQLTKTLAATWAEQGIRANEVAVGLIESSTQAEPISKPLRRLPLGRCGQADDVAGAVLFLASDAARFITGETLMVDGGLSVALP